MPRFRSLGEWATYVRGLGERLRQAHIRGLRIGAEESIPMLQERTARAGADVTHEFIRGWRVQIEPGAVRIVNIAPHAGYVEYGRRPGRMPPVDNIALWVALKFGIGGMEGRKIAWGIAKKIAARGVRGKYILKNARGKIKRNIAMAVLREAMNEFRKKS